jgi:hypothetical protein
VALDVRQIGGEIARPFVEGACCRYELPYDPQSGSAMLWYAGIERGGLRAVMGWADTPDLSVTADPVILVIGPFGDGSGFEDVWMNELLRSMQIVRAQFVVVPASPSLFIRRQSAQLERYGMVRTPQYARAS